MREPVPARSRSLKASFPTLRPLQAGALAEIAASFDRRTKFTVVEAPTGAGKSGICMAPAIWSAEKAESKGVQYLTSQISLCQQLVEQFGNRGVVQISGKRNYACHTHDRVNCEDGPALNPGGKACEGCPYQADADAYRHAPMKITNYPYYLTTTRHSDKLLQRDWLICDEAHSIERELLTRAEIIITQRLCDDLAIGQLPRFTAKEDGRFRHWISRTLMVGLNRRLSFIGGDEMGLLLPANGRTAQTLDKSWNFLRQLRSNLEEYLDTPERGDWLAWTEEDRAGSLRIRPLSAASFAQRDLFPGSANILMTPATILDFATFRRNLGIPSEKFCPFAVPSEFPPKNRRILCWPVRSMTSKNTEATLPLLAERMARVIKKHAAGKKGIVHTHSYRINGYLLDALGKGEHAHRLISHTNIPGEREQAIRNHYATKVPSILMSPSMTEGLDLKDDLARLQIITKIPYPVLDPTTEPG